MDVDVGVIYTHEREFMSPLVTSLAHSVRGVSARLLLVDNASRDGVSEWQREFADTRVLHNPEPLGYAANLNRILVASDARYVLLLNTDMYFAPEANCVAAMVQFMETHPECGLSGCRLYHADGSFAYPARRFQTWSTIAARRLGLGRLFPGTLDSYLYRAQSEEDIYECDWLSGCFMMVRRAAMQEVGYFDCGFRKYFEDVDYCLRMARGGWRVMYNGQTWGYHCEQRASRRLLSQDAREHLRSYARWLWKWGWQPQRAVNRKISPVPQPVSDRAA